MVEMYVTVLNKRYLNESIRVTNNASNVRVGTIQLIRSPFVLPVTYSDLNDFGQ